VKMYVDRISSMDILCGTVGHLSWLRSTAENEGGIYAFTAKHSNS